tara:strand:+ start:596 stop:823 length:228 start_codon:yes stop_codon:yes gene_type:complete
MGSLLGSRTPPKSKAELDQERRMEEERIKAEEEKAKLLAEQEKYKKRKLKGLIGQRSLFAKAGGRGFYDEGKEIT